MTKYTVKLFGSAAVVPVEWEWSDMSLESAKDTARRRLPHYYPTYFNLAMWDEDKKLVLELTSYVAVKETGK